MLPLWQGSSNLFRILEIELESYGLQTTKWALFCSFWSLTAASIHFHKEQPWNTYGLFLTTFMFNEKRLHVLSNMQGSGWMMTECRESLKDKHFGSKCWAKVSSLTSLKKPVQFSVASSKGLLSHCNLSPFYHCYIHSSECVSGSIYVFITGFSHAELSFSLIKNPSMGWTGWRG